MGRRDSWLREPLNLLCRLLCLVDLKLFCRDKLKVSGLRELRPPARFLWFLHFSLKRNVGLIPVVQNLINLPLASAPPVQAIMLTGHLWSAAELVICPFP